MKPILYNFLGPSGAGKDTGIPHLIALKKEEGLSVLHVSIGSVVKEEAAKRKILPTRRNLQKLHAQMAQEHPREGYGIHAIGAIKMLEKMEQEQQEPFQIAFINGARHPQVVKHLRQYAKTRGAQYVPIFIESDIQIRRTRSEQRERLEAENSQELEEALQRDFQEAYSCRRQRGTSTYIIENNTTLEKYFAQLNWIDERTNALEIMGERDVHVYTGNDGLPIIRYRDKVNPSIVNRIFIDDIRLDGTKSEIDIYINRLYDGRHSKKGSQKRESAHIKLVADQNTLVTTVRPDFRYVDSYDLSDPWDIGVKRAISLLRGGISILSADVSFHPRRKHQYDHISIEKRKNLEEVISQPMIGDYGVSLLPAVQLINGHVTSIDDIDDIYTGQRIPVLDPLTEQLLGIEFRNIIHEYGLWHKGIQVHIIRPNDHGTFDILVQRRSGIVDLAQGLLDQSQATQMIESDKLSEDIAIQRGLSTEWGITSFRFLKLPIGGIRAIKTYEAYPRKINRELLSLHLVVAEVQEPQNISSKIEEMFWMEWSDFVQAAQTRPDEFTKTAKFYLQDDSLRNYIEQQSYNLLGIPNPLPKTIPTNMQDLMYLFIDTKEGRKETHIFPASDINNYQNYFI